MKVIGVLTQNFALYHELVKILREKGVKFESLCWGKVPAHIGVILTSKQEAKQIKFKNKVIVGRDVDIAVQKAQEKLLKIKFYSNLTIGIDPGERPGLAVFADGRLVQVAQATKPEEAGKIVQRILRKAPARAKVVKIGHGAKTLRNRIINQLLKLKIPVKIVDETKTTGGKAKDLQAAIEIGRLEKGKFVARLAEIKPTPGELKDIQRKARVESGILTISKELAAKVAKGELTLEEAIRRQKRKLSS